MMKSRYVSLSLVVAFLALFHGGFASASTSITYQGELQFHGVPLDERCDFRVTLWNAEFGGKMISPLVELFDVEVHGGRMSLELNFNDGVFDDGPRWLEISVGHPAGGDDFVRLSPRQGIRSANIVSPTTTGTEGSEGAEGQEGPVGPEGPVGAAGPQGPQGNPGATTTGPRGPKGERGSAGTQGPEGPEGPVGPAGGFGSVSKCPWTVRANLIYYTHGDVGIGTTTPQSLLHLFGHQATLTLQDDDDPASFSEFIDAAPTQLRINKVNGAGSVLLDLNPMPADGTSNALVRFFRQTNTTGVKGLRVYRGDGTASPSALIGADGEDSAFQLHGGNFGIGTSTPVNPLHVHAGSSGSIDNHTATVARFERNGTAYVNILGADGFERGLFFGDAENYFNGGIVYNNPDNTDGFQFRTGGNQVQMTIEDSGLVIMKQRLGVGNPTLQFGELTVVDSGAGSPYSIFAAHDHDSFSTLYLSNQGSGGAISIDAVADVSLSGGGLVVVGNPAGPNMAFDRNEIMARNNGEVSDLYLNHNGGDVYVGLSSGGTSRLVTPVLSITGGSDFSEMFDVAGAVEVQPGMVVVIDPENPGRLMPSTDSYDRKVAGIISGAGGVATGMTMGHDGTIADGEHPVALTGRVYCFVDATEHAIVPGDMLTTSTKFGHAMKAIDEDRLIGTIIGKAMTALPKGEVGLVLVLVNLQ